MNLRFSLFTASILLSAQASFAQLPNNILACSNQKGRADGPVAKPTSGTGSRLISYIVMTHDGASYVNSDSVNFAYSGTRGGELGQEIIKYDNALDLQYNTVTSSWDNSAQVVQTFDANNNLLTHIVKTWVTATNSWVNSQQSTYTYDGNNNMLSQIDQNWNTSTNSWDNHSKSLYTYDANNNQTDEVYQVWNTSTNTWDNSTQYIYTYNAANKITVQISQTWSATWQNNSKTTNTYDANNNRLTNLYQTWNGSTSSWDNSSLHTNTYGAANEMLTDLYQHWNAGTASWDNSSKYVYSNFAGINPQTSITQHWNAATSSFDNYARSLATYNSYGQYLTVVADSWNIGGFWQPKVGDQSYRMHYEEYATDVKGVSAKNGNADIYPVPAGDKLNIDLQWNESQPFTITLVDIQGRMSRVWQVAATASYHNTISVADMPSGTYFIKIEGTKGSVTKQLIVAPR